MIRFSKSNWDRFKTNNKKTTIRLREVKTGIHACGSGSPQWGNWKRWGTVYVHPFVAKKKVIDLNSEDAERDGFDSLTELLIELGKLNKTITVNDYVYIHPVEVKKED